jgi:hypothetical protein
MHALYRTLYALHRRSRWRIVVKGQEGQRAAMRWRRLFRGPGGAVRCAGGDGGYRGRGSSSGSISDGERTRSDLCLCVCLSVNVKLPTSERRWWVVVASEVNARQGSRHHQKSRLRSAAMTRKRTDDECHRGMRQWWLWQVAQHTTHITPTTTPP